MAQFPVPTVNPLGPKTQVVLSPRTHWDHLLLGPCSVPCVVKLGPPLRGLAQTQPHLHQKRPPPEEMHLQPPAPSRGASRQGRRPGRPPDCGIWQRHPQHQFLRPLPTSPRFPSCLIHQPPCTTRLWDLPQPRQPEPPPLPQSRPLQPPPGRPGDPGTPSSWTWRTWRSSTRP